MRNANKEELFVGLFISILLGAFLTLLLVGLELSEDDAKSRAIEKYNTVYSVLDDEQKRRADSLSPVCSESKFNMYSCEKRTDFLEKLYLSGDDIPQSGIHVNDN